MDTATFKASQCYPGYPLPDYVNYAKLRPSVEHAMVLAKCNTVRRRSGFLAQTGAESGSYRWMAEIDSGAQYNWRSELGNTHPGDGQRFKGGGPIQLTGRHNYTKFSKWAWKNRVAIKAQFGVTIPSKTYYVAHPKLVQTVDAHGMLAAVYYWTVARNMNSYCDRNDIVGMTQAVNGGYNNLSGRTKRYRKCKSLGTKILADPVVRPKPAPAPAKPPVKKPVTPKPPTAKPKPQRGKRKPVVYVVKSGDTLGAIAARYTAHKRTVSWQQIRKANKLKNANLIKVGQKLVIP